MKNILKLIFLSSALVTFFAACKKDEHKDYFQGGTPPVLTATTNSGGASINLSYDDRDKQGILLSWTNPNYQFTTGLSSQDVSYKIEIDTAGAKFSNPNRQSIAVSKDLSYAISVGQFNDYLLNQLQLDTSVNHDLEIRVTSTLATGAVPLVSNVVPITAMPYAIPPKVKLPPGKLFLVGSATPGGDAHGWDNPVPVPSQEFTMISPTQYEITIPLIGGKEYLFLPVNGDWSHKYAVKDKTVPGLSDGGDFAYDASDNFPGPAASGTYKIQVDFQRGKFTVTKQ